ARGISVRVERCFRPFRHCFVQMDCNGNVTSAPDPGQGYRPVRILDEGTSAPTSCRHEHVQVLVAGLLQSADLLAHFGCIATSESVRGHRAYPKIATSWRVSAAGRPVGS